MDANTVNTSSAWRVTGWLKSMATYGRRFLERLKTSTFSGASAVLVFFVLVLILLPDLVRFRRRQSKIPAPASSPKQQRTEPMKATDKQVGGNHYTAMAIQPMTYSMANGLDPCQHTIIKYVSRFRQKGGIQDLEKARHTLDLLIEFERAKL